MTTEERLEKQFNMIDNLELGSRSLADAVRLASDAVRQGHLHTREDIMKEIETSVDYALRHYKCAFDRCDEINA